MIIGGGLAGGTYLSSTMAPLVIQSGGGRYCREFIFEVKAPSGPDGLTRIGSSNSTNNFMKRQAGKDVGVSFALEYGFGDFGNCTDVYGWTHGNSAYDRTGVMTAGSHTILKSWPMQPPPGRAIFEEFYIGQSRHKALASIFDPTTGTMNPPPSGTWNPGDRIYCIGQACVAGGPEGIVCVTEGAVGIYSEGRKATTNGKATVLVDGLKPDVEVALRPLTIGMVLTFVVAKPGQPQRISTPRRIKEISSWDAVNENMILTMDGDILDSVSGVPMSESGLEIEYSQPVFKRFGSIAP